MFPVYCTLVNFWIRSHTFALAILDCNLPIYAAFFARWQVYITTPSLLVSWGLMNFFSGLAFNNGPLYLCLTSSWDYW
jgi:hypothetical protein